MDGWMGGWMDVCEKVFLVNQMYGRTDGLV